MHGIECSRRGCQSSPAVARIGAVHTSGQAGIELVGESENEQDVPLLVAATKPDFLLIALEESRRRPPLCDLLLRKFPALRIIAVAPNTNVGIFYWASFDIHSRTMEASEEALLEAVRSSAVPAKGGVG